MHHLNHRAARDEGVEIVPLGLEIVFMIGRPKLDGCAGLLTKKGREMKAIDLAPVPQTN
jgi:hypothetical protein